MWNCGIEVDIIFYLNGVKQFYKFMARKKKKQHDNLTETILLAAKKQFLEHGYVNTSMRKIAAEVGISPTTIYLYYRDKADVVHALHQEGFKILAEQFKTLENVSDPFERLKAMGRCYINFAFDNPDFYEIMFIMQEPLEHIGTRNNKEDAVWEEGKEAYETLLSVVGDCREAGYFKAYKVSQMALLLWVNLHGMCALKNNGHLGLLARTMEGKPEVTELIYSSFELYIQIVENV